MKKIYYISFILFLILPIQFVIGQNSRTSNDGYKPSLKANEVNKSNQQGGIISQFDGNDRIIQKDRTGGANISRIDQIGTGQYSGSSRYDAGQNQSGRQGGFLFIEQFGNKNITVQEGKTSGKVISQQYGDDNLARIRESEGRNNEAVVSQKDDGNRAYLDQRNNDNQTRINQLKGQNQANIYQDGKSNIIQIDQSSGGRANIRQYGTKNAVKGNGSSWAESLNGSILDVEQIGSFNELDIQQNHSKASLNQSGIRNKTVIIQK